MRCAPMNVLAIETATALGGVAVVGPDGLMAERAAYVPGGHLEWLVPAIDAVLGDAGLRRDEVDALAVSIGPGGFSGLRIGVTTAASWAHARGLPLVAVATLDVLAAGLGARGLVLAAIDARRGEVAAALYSVGDDLHRLTQDLLAAPDGLPRCLPDREQPVIIVGDALERHGPALLMALAPGASAAPRDRWWPRASVGGLMARARLAQGQHDDPVGLVPHYVQRPPVQAVER